MDGKTYLLDKEFEAVATAVVKHRIVKVGASDDLVIHAAAVGDAMFGVVQHDAAIGARARVALYGITEIEYGGTISQGDLLTSDATGKAVAAAPILGVNNSVIGRAMKSGVVGDIGAVILFPGQIQGA